MSCVICGNMIFKKDSEVDSDMLLTQKRINAQYHGCWNIDAIRQNTDDTIGATEAPEGEEE